MSSFFVSSILLPITCNAMGGMCLAMACDEDPFFERSLLMGLISGIGLGVFFSASLEAGRVITRAFGAVLLSEASPWISFLARVIYHVLSPILFSLLYVDIVGIRDIFLDLLDDTRDWVEKSIFTGDIYNMDFPLS